MMIQGRNSTLHELYLSAKMSDAPDFFDEDFQPVTVKMRPWIVRVFRFPLTVRVMRKIGLPWSASIRAAAVTLRHFGRMP